MTKGTAARGCLLSYPRGVSGSVRLFPCGMFMRVNAQEEGTQDESVHQSSLICRHAAGRGLRIGSAGFAGNQNRPATGGSRGSRSTAKTSPGICVGGGLLVPGGKALQVA